MCACSFEWMFVSVYCLCYDDNDGDGRKVNDKGILISFMLCAIDGNWNTQAILCCMAIAIKMFSSYKII